MKVGNDIETKRADWSFDEKVAKNFVEHAEKSIPFYHEGHELICQLSDYFVKQDSVCYEIGTSTGELIRKLATHNEHKPGIRWIGVDRETAMINQAKKHCKDIKNIELYYEDLFAHDFEMSDFIVSNYVMQFIPPKIRQDAFNRIYEKLNWGGAFILFEKVRGPDARYQDILSQLYIDFKIRNGFSSEEILNKSISLKSVLEPFSTQGNIELMNRAGFIDVMTIFKYGCFEGFIAIK